MLLGATAGTDRHQMVLDFAMRPLFTYLRTRIAATAVFAGPQDWGNNDDGGSPLSVRVDRAAGEFVGLLQDSGPQQKPAALESLPFEQLLAGISGHAVAARPSEPAGPSEPFRRPARCPGHEVSRGFY